MGKQRANDIHVNITGLYSRWQNRFSSDQATQHPFDIPICQRPDSPRYAVDRCLDRMKVVKIEDSITGSEALRQAIINKTSLIRRLIPSSHISALCDLLQLKPCSQRAFSFRGEETGKTRRENWRYEKGRGERRKRTQ